LRVAEGGLADDQVGHDRLVRFPRIERLQLVLEPSTVWFLRCEASLDGVVLLEAAVLGIDAKHLSRSELPATDTAMSTDIDGAGFRSARDQSVLADGVAQRPKAVAAGCGAEARPVGEYEPRGPIHGLHQAG